MTASETPTAAELKYWRQFGVSQCILCRQETAIPLRHAGTCAGVVLVPDETPWTPAPKLRQEKPAKVSKKWQRETTSYQRENLSALKNLRTGGKVGRFTILALPSEAAGCLVRVRCVCNRVRLISALQLGKGLAHWETCGCNGIDRGFLTGDPNLPTDVDSLDALCLWAGTTRFTHYKRVYRYGLPEALAVLAAEAERAYPGEGWRIAAVIPVPGQPPLDLATANGERPR